MVQAMEYGCRSVIIGIGGSATNDGGMGLFVRPRRPFYDGAGRPVTSRTGAEMLQVRRVDLSGLPDLSGISIQVACDVTNPLCGPDGASAVLAPKGCGLSDGGGIGSGPCPVRRSSLPGHGTGYTIHAGLRCSWRRRRRLYTAWGWIWFQALAWSSRPLDCGNEWPPATGFSPGKEPPMLPPSLARCRMPWEPWPRSSISPPSACAAACSPGYKPLYHRGILGAFSIPQPAHGSRLCMAHPYELIRDGAENPLSGHVPGVQKT